MAVHDRFIWSALLPLGVAAHQAAAALAECDATSLLQGQKALDPGPLLAPQQTRRWANGPMITPSNYWMFNFARHRSRTAVTKSIAAMENVTASANTFPAFEIPGACTACSANGTATKRMLEKLKGAYTTLKHDLTLHQKGQSHALFTIHTLLPLELQLQDSQFQERWKGALHEVVSAVHRHRAFLANAGAASQVCARSAVFLEDLHREVGNYSRFMDGALEMLPPPLPRDNGFINATALEARRSMYASSRDMMLRLDSQVSEVLPAFLNQTGSCVRPEQQQQQQQQQQQSPPQQQQQQQQQQPQQQQVVEPQEQQPPPPPQQQRRRKTPWPDIEPESAVTLAREQAQDNPGELQREEQQQKPQEQPRLHSQQEQAAEPQPQQSSAPLRSCGVWFLLATLGCSPLIW